MAEDRRPAPTDWRFDPFTESYNAIAITDEDREIPGASPYQVRLYEVPRENTPWSITCVILVQLDEPLDAVETGVDIVAAHYARVIVGDIILVDAEQMEVIAKPGSPTLTVTRGYGGTGAAGHTTGTWMEILASMTQVGSGSPATREYRVDYDYDTGLVLFNSAEKGYDVRFDYWGLGTPLYAGVQWIQTNMREYGVGDHLVVKSDSQVTVTNLTYILHKEFKLDRLGALRIKFDLYADGSGDSCYGKIYKNGGAVGTERIKGVAGWTTYSEDITDWAVNDLVQLYCKKLGVAGVTKVRDFTLYADEMVGARRTELDLPVGY